MNADDQILSTVKAICAATGVSRWTVCAVRKTSRGKEDSPYFGRFTTARRFTKWLMQHREFVASHVLLKKPIKKEYPCRIKANIRNLPSSLDGKSKPTQV